MIKAILDIKFPLNRHEDFEIHFKDLNAIKEWIKESLPINSEKYLKFETGANNLYYIYN